MVRYTVNNVIWDLYILLKSVLKMLEMPFQRPQIQKQIPGDMPSDPPRNVSSL